MKNVLILSIGIVLSGCIPSIKVRPAEHQGKKDCEHIQMFYGPFKTVDAIQCGKDKFRKIEVK